MVAEKFTTPPCCFPRSDAASRNRRGAAVDARKKLHAQSSSRPSLSLNHDRHTLSKVRRNRQQRSRWHGDAVATAAAAAAGAGAGQRGKRRRMRGVCAGVMVCRHRTGHAHMLTASPCSTPQKESKGMPPRTAMARGQSAPSASSISTATTPKSTSTSTTAWRQRYETNLGGCYRSCSVGRAPWAGPRIR